MPCLFANVLNQLLDTFVILPVVNVESETFTPFHYSSS